MLKWVCLAKVSLTLFRRDWHLREDHIIFGGCDKLWGLVLFHLVSTHAIVRLSRNWSLIFAVWALIPTAVAFTAANAHLGLGIRVVTDLEEDLLKSCDRNTVRLNVQIGKIVVKLAEEVLEHVRVVTWDLNSHLALNLA